MPSSFRGYVCYRTDREPRLIYSFLTAFVSQLKGKIAIMIKMHINEMLGDRSHYWLAKTTQIEYSVIRNLASQRSQRISYPTLEKICAALHCQPGDLLIMGRTRP